MKLGLDYIKKKIAADKTDPRQRFLNLDGSRYLSEGLQRLWTVPYLKGAVVLDFAVSAFEVFGLPESLQNPKVLLGILGMNALAIPVSLLGLSVLRDNDMPVSPNSAIDTTGQLGPEPDASEDMRGYYKFIGVFMGAGLPMATFGASHFIFEIPFWANIGLLTIPMSVAAVPFGGWCLYAAHKLKRGHWTIHTSPPAINEEPAGVAEEDLISIPITRNVERPVARKPAAPALPNKKLAA